MPEPNITDTADTLEIYAEAIEEAGHRAAADDVARAADTLRWWARQVDSDRPVPSGRRYVIGKSRSVLLDWARANGVDPNDRESNVVLVSCSSFAGPDRLRGVALGAGDQVHYIAGWQDGVHSHEVAKNIGLARRRTPTETIPAPES